LSNKPIFLIISVLFKPGFPVDESVWGSLETDERNSSTPVSIADNAVERANASEKAYLAARVSSGSADEGNAVGNISSGLDSSNG